MGTTRTLLTAGLLAGLLIVTAGPADALVWTQDAELKPGSAGGGNSFAALDGSIAIVGDRSDGDTTQRGAAYIFENSGGTWSQTATLRPSDGGSNDRFGWSVAVSGTTAVVGSINHSSYKGAAYIFQKVGDTWTQTAKLMSSDADNGDRFGWSVAISGSTVIVGASGDWHTLEGMGAAYVFEDSGGTWTQAAKLTASDAGFRDYFGGCVSLSGTTAVVGVMDSTYGSQGGAAYVFDGSSGWHNMTETAMLTATDAGVTEKFGQAVSIDGTTVVVGAYAWDGYNGAAYVFDGSGGWADMTETAKLLASDSIAGYPDEQLGRSVSLSGTRVLAGSPGQPPFGAAYVFDGSGGWTGTMTEEARFVGSDGVGEFFFGSSVSLDGLTALGAAAPNLVSRRASYIFSAEAPVDDPPVADAGGSYQFSATQLAVTLDGSGSMDDFDIASYSWDVDGGTTILSGVSPLLSIQNSGLSNPSDVVDVVLTVTDTAAQTDMDTTTISYQNSAPVINLLEAIVDPATVQFTGEVQDGDFIVNQWISDFQVVNWELDLVKALTAGDVGDGFYTASVGGTHSDATFPIDVTVPLSELPPGWVTVWLNVSGSLTTGSVTFFNHYPEPATFTLLALGGLGLLCRRRRRR